MTFFVELRFGRIFCSNTQRPSERVHLLPTISVWKKSHIHLYSPVNKQL